MTKLLRISLLLVVCILLAGCSRKVKNPALIINEVMVVNETNFTDNFGQRNAWIEIYNNTAATRNLAGMFLTTDKNNPKMYAIPRGDVLTQIKPHQHVLFWADAEPIHGTFHTNFQLNPDKDNYIALFDVDGKTLIDELVVPAKMLADQTYGYEMDGHKYDMEGKLLAKTLNRTTPSSNNEIVGENPKIVDLKKNDPEGITLTITSMLVVFVGLLLLFLVFKFTGNTAANLSKKRAAQKGSFAALRSETQLSGEVLAAISAAIHQMNENQHDIESTILTIQQVKRNYSPWNAKRQMLRESPR